jgi:hypothetical protein
VLKVSVAAIEFGSSTAGRAVPDGVPGPDVAAALDALDVGALSDDELMDAMAAWRRVTSWAQSKELAVVAEFVRRRESQHPNAPGVKLGEFIADEIAATLTLSGGAAGMWAGLACKLADPLSLTHQALAEGRIDLGRARVIADGLLGVDPDTAALVEKCVIGDAQVRTAARLRHRVREAITEVDPEAAEQRRQRARKVRSLEKWATAAGTCELAFREMSEEDAEAIYNRINAVAQAMRADGDVRPIDAIRHDLGVALLRGTPLPQAARDLRHTEDDGEHVGRHDDQHADHSDAHRANTPHADHSDAHRANTPADWDGRDGPAGTARPGEDGDVQAPTGSRSPTRRSPERNEPAGRGRTDGHGHDDEDAVAAAAAQITDMLAKVIDERLNSVADRHRASGRRTGLALRVTAAMQTMSSALAELKERWCQTTTGQGSTGVTTGAHGHHGYRPPAGMRRLIERTHQVCAFPTCDRPAPRCDLDHTIAWHQGGPTCPCNMSALCRRHHRLKQHPQWQLFQPWPGLLVWVTPAGKWHTVIPENRQ